MNKQQIENEIEALFTRLCAGVIAKNEDFKLANIFSGSNLTKYNIQCNAEDCPRVLGKGGSRFKAVRTLMRLAGAKLGRAINLETMEPPKVGKPRPFPPFKFNPRWPKQEISLLLDDVCSAVFDYSFKIKLTEAVGAAIFSVKLTAKERPEVIEAASEAIQNIFMAIGVTNGCQLSVDIGVEE